MSFTKFFLLLSTVVGASVAAPAARSAQDVYVPPITYPTADAQWVVGHSYNVTWNTSNPPAQITNSKGSVVLAKDYYLIGLQYPLASGFNILDGWVEVQVPDDAIPGDDYQVVLFGDSGNYSPTFSIVAA